MDIGKKMMEKWGWNKGQGLGKDNKGMTSCLVLKKNDGSSTQGRIEMSHPTVYSAKTTVQDSAAAAAGAAATPGLVPLQPADATMAPADLAAGQAGMAGLLSAGIDPSSLFDIDPRELAGANAPAGMAEAAAFAANELSKQLAAMQAQGGMAAAVAATIAQDTAADMHNLAGVTLAVPETNIAPQQPRATPTKAPSSTFSDYQPPPKRIRIRQYVRDDWRWSKGTEALWCFEEVQLAPSLQTLAKKVLGEGSLYPARIADDTDCVTEVTAWGSLLVRPRGTGANIALAKRMLFEVLHPLSGDLREEVLITPDEMAEAALQDKTLISAGMDNADRVTQGVERSFHGKLRRVGLGAVEEVMSEVKEEKSAFTEMILATSEDAALVKKHLEDLRIAFGCTPVLNGVSLRLFGKDKPVRKAQHLVTTLVETGEWVALTEGFVLSEETKGKRRANDGPSEQILIKVAEGPATQKIEQHLKAMERAALAEQLKLTSKAVGGKRTLMVEGTKAAHERVKLMVRELSEKGESPMLTKALGFARAAERPAGADIDVKIEEEIPEAPRQKPEVFLAPGSMLAPTSMLPPSSNSRSTPGIGAPFPPVPPGMAEVVDLYAGLPDAEAEAEEAPAATAPPAGTDDSSEAQAAAPAAPAAPVAPEVIAPAAPETAASDGVTE